MNQLNPVLNKGEYVFVTVLDTYTLDPKKIIGFFKEKEGNTLIIEKELAEQLSLPYYFKAAWLTLEASTSLNAIGLTAAFSSALANQNISCNVVAGYHHDHIFVDHTKATEALNVLQALAVN